MSAPELSLFKREAIVVAGGGRDLPPTECPICGAITGSGWDVYFAHMNPNHPEYMTWKKRMGSRYLLALVPLMGLILLGVAMGANLSQAPYSASVGDLLFAFAFPSTLPVLVGVWMVKRRGTERFREQWKIAHQTTGRQASFAGVSDH